MNNLVTLEEKEEMRQVFQSLDSNGSGLLRREDLIDGDIYIYIYIYIIYLGFHDMHGEGYPVTSLVDDIMSRLDLDHNGLINYSGNNRINISTC